MKRRLISIVLAVCFLSTLAVLFTTASYGPRSVSRPPVFWLWWANKREFIQHQGVEFSTEGMDFPIWNDQRVSLSWLTRERWNEAYPRTPGRRGDD